MKNTAGCVVAVLVLGSVLGSAIEGQAANLEVQFIDMTNNLLATCRDNAACDSAGAVGTIIFNLAVAGASAEGVATAAPGPFGLTLLYDVGGTAANNYRIAISEDDLSGSNLVWTGGVGGTQSGIDTTSFDVFAHTGNVKFLGDTGVCQAGPFSGTTFGPAAATCESLPFSATAFSLTELVDISGVQRATGASLFTVGTVDVPEPGTLLLLASGLAATGMYGRGRAFREREK